MKYLKTFESNIGYDESKYQKNLELKDQIKDQIEDIFLDLRDSGYRVNVVSTSLILKNGEDSSWSKSDTINRFLVIIINKHNHKEFGEEFIETINRLRNYLDYIGYDTTDLVPWSIDNYQVHSLNINFFEDGKNVKVKSSIQY